MSIERIRQLRTLQRNSGIDYVALVPGPNLSYFTGLHMHLSERPFVVLLPADDAARTIIVTQFFEIGKATSGPVPLHADVFHYRDGQPFQEAFDAAAKQHGLAEKVIGVEPTQMRVLEWSLLSTAARIRQASALDIIATLRMRKDAAELAAMRKAAQVAEHAFAQLLEDLRPGMTEKQAAAALMNHMLQAGAEGPSFEPLVQFGPSASNPHGASGSRALQAGDFALFDFGAVVDGYPCDITRTICLGAPSDEMKRIYEVVQAANAAGRAAVRPGTTPEEIDRVTRDVIEKAGYGQYFTHRTGHGLGLEIHEPPYLWAGNTLPLEPGMTFTIEPGIYIPGLGGVRVEDDMVVTETGGESLTSFERNLIRIDA
jgi:Xaa-Pro dipeptidase